MLLVSVRLKIDYLWKLSRAPQPETQTGFRWETWSRLEESVRGYMDIFLGLAEQF